jgi:hypothetical protein
MREGFYPISKATGGMVFYTDLTFLPSHPPDIPIRNSIVAVCGISDDDGNASPEVDGWFLRDFYLSHPAYKYAFYRTPCYCITAMYRRECSNQVWLLCEIPDGLVKKYQEYAHEDLRKERRVVCLPYTF